MEDAEQCSKVLEISNFHAFLSAPAENRLQRSSGREAAGEAPCGRPELGQEWCGKCAVERRSFRVCFEFKSANFPLFSACYETAQYEFIRLLSGKAQTA